MRRASVRPCLPNTDVDEPVPASELIASHEPDHPRQLDPHIRRALILPPSAAADEIDLATLTSFGLATPGDKAATSSQPTSSRWRYTRRGATTPSGTGRPSLTTEDDDYSHLLSSDTYLGGPRVPGTGRGAMHLLRNMPSVMVANAVAEHALRRQLADLTVEKRNCIRRRDRARSAFVDRLKARGGPIGQLAADIESGKRRRKRAAPPAATSVTRRRFRRRRRTSCSKSSQSIGNLPPPVSSPAINRLRDRPLTVHSLPLLTDFRSSSAFQQSEDHYYDTTEEEDEDINVGDRGGDGLSSVVVETPTSSARNTTMVIPSAVRVRPKTARPRSSAPVADRKCKSATVSSCRQADNITNIETSCYMYEPHVVVQRRDINNRIYTVLVPVGKAVPIVETSPSRHSSAVTAAASLGLPHSEQTNSHERRRKKGAIDPPSSLDLEGEHDYSVSSIDDHRHIPTTSRSPQSNIRLSKSRTNASGEQQNVQPLSRSTSGFQTASIEKRTVQSAIVTAVVPDGGGVGLDIEVMRLIASVDSLHVPSSRRLISTPRPTSRLKSKRTMQTIMADLDRIF